MFRQSFIEFLETSGVEFTLQRDFFIFPEHHLEILLVPKDSPLHSDYDAPAGDTSSNDRLYLYEDRWMSGGEVLRKRILARLGHFRSIFARKCKIVSGSSIAPIVASFLEENHSYGNAQCKHRYALLCGDEMVAVATFSKPRPMPREDGRTYLSFEWVRYASVPGTRVVGGMGKLLKAFLKDAALMGQEVGMPVEVMSYSDNEWSSGGAYSQLGFKQIGERAPVKYMVDCSSYERYSVRKYSLIDVCSGDYYEIYNKGSKKFLYICP
jgi:hypothetical protein